jgi:solute:Na+ symporter, SSS family
MTSTVFIIGAVLLLIISVGWTIATRKRDSQTYSPPNSLSKISLVRDSTRSTIIWTHVATSLGGAVTISFIGLIYKDGTFYIAAGFAFIIGLLIYRALLPFMFKHFTESEEIEDLDSYISNNRPAPKFLVALTNFLIFSLLALAQFTSVLLLFGVIGAPAPELLLALSICLVLIYLLYGAAGVFVTEKIQTCAIFFWLASLIYYIPTKFDVVAFASLDPAYLSGLSKGPVLLIAVIAIFPWTAVARSDLWQRSMSSKSSDDARMAISYLTLVMALVYLLMGAVGVTLFSLEPGIPNYNAAAFLVLDSLPAMWAGLAVLGIFAALISSADSMLNLATISGFNLLKIVGVGVDSGFLGKHISLLGALGLAIYFLVLGNIDLGSIVILASTASAILVPSLLLRVFSDKPYPASKSVSIGLGMIVAVVTLFLTGDPTIAFVPASVLASIVVIFGRKIEKTFSKSAPSNPRDGVK